MKKKPAAKKVAKKKIDAKTVLDVTELERVYGGLRISADGTKGETVRF